MRLKLKGRNGRCIWTWNSLGLWLLFFHLTKRKHCYHFPESTGGWSVQFSSIKSLSRIRFFVIPWTAACQASLSITNSQSLLKFISIESVMPSNHLMLCCPLLLLPSVFPSIRVFSSESVLHIRWPEYRSFSLNISPSNEHSGYSPHGCRVGNGWSSLAHSTQAGHTLALGLCISVLHLPPASIATPRSLTPSDSPGTLVKPLTPRIPGPLPLFHRWPSEGALGAWCYLSSSAFEVAKPSLLLECTRPDLLQDTSGSFSKRSTPLFRNI